MTSLPPLHLRCFTLGHFETNCYLLWTEGSTSCWLIDASFDPRAMIDEVQNLGLTPKHLLLTHAHCDHIAGIPEVLRAWTPKPRVSVHPAETAWLTDPVLNLSGFGGMPISTVPPDDLLSPGDSLSLNGYTFNVLHTPGHSPGGVSFYCAQANIVISGDALFAGSIGRTDFPGSDHNTLLAAIRTQLYTLPPNTKVCPGHGPPTTIAREMMSNPYVRAK